MILDVLDNNIHTEFNAFLFQKINSINIIANVKQHLL